MSSPETTALKLIQELSKNQQKINSSFNARLEALEKRLDNLGELSTK